MMPSNGRSEAKMADKESNMDNNEEYGATASAVNEISIFGEKITISPECVEYGRLQKKFDALAEEQARAAAADIGREAEDVDAFCRSGNRWAHRFIDKTSDIAADEMIAFGIYDFDRSMFIEKFLDASPWDRAFAAFVKEIGSVDEEEGARESERMIKSEIADSDGLGERMWQGLKNMGGRAIYAGINASRKKDILKENVNHLIDGIYRTIKLSIEEVSACLEAVGCPLNIKSGIASCEKAKRLFNNLKDGKIPAAAVNTVKAQIIALNPYDAEFYEWVYVNEGDASGELASTADRFGVSLDKVKGKAFEKRLGNCAFETAEATLAYREKAVRLGAELRYDPKEVLAKIDAELDRIEKAGRTTFGVVYSTKEEAVAARGSRGAFLKGVEKAVEECGVADLYTAVTAPQKKLANARASFPVPANEVIYALNDTTAFGSCKTGLAITGWGLRWRNDPAHPTRVASMSWEAYARIPEMPKVNGDVITFAHGITFCNTGSNVAPMKIFWLVRCFWEWCRTATFVDDIPSDEIPAQPVPEPLPTTIPSQGLVRDALAAWKACMRKYADFSGRAGRMEYWSFLCVNVIATIVLSVVSMGLMGIVYVLATAVPMFSAMVRRFHDQGRSGLMCLVGFIPIVGPVIAFVLLLQSGENAENRYGPVTSQY